MSNKQCPIKQVPCIGGDCAWFSQVRGTDPNTGNEIDESGCSVRFMPMLMIEVSKAQYQTGAAVESARNVFAEALEGAPRIPHD